MRTNAGISRRAGGNQGGVLWGPSRNRVIGTAKYISPGFHTRFGIQSLIKRSMMNKMDLILTESEKAFRQDLDRTKNLRQAAERLVAAVAVVMGFHLFELDKISFTGEPGQVLSGWLAVGALTTMVVSLFLSLLSMKVWNYLSYPRGKTILDELDDENVSDHDAKVKVALMYLTAYDHNAGINDKRAGLILFSTVILVLGLLLAASSYLIEKIII